MEKLIKAFDDLPWIVKLVLCIPCVAVVWSIYKLCRSVVKNNVVGIVLAVLTVVPGIAIFWLIDLICLIVNKEVWWID